MDKKISTDIFITAYSIALRTNENMKICTKLKSIKCDDACKSIVDTIN